MVQDRDPIGGRMPFALLPLACDLRRRARELT
jgi:hypothetical protein